MPLSSVVFRCPAWAVFRMEQYNQSLASAGLARLPGARWEKLPQLRLRKGYLRGLRHLLITYLKLTGIFVSDFQS